MPTVALFGYFLAVAVKGTPIRCSLQKVVDSQASQLLAYSYLLPKGWKGQGSVNWPNPGEVNATLYAVTPDYQYAVLQVERFISSYNQMGNNPPRGPRTGGFVQGVVIHHATDLLKRFAQNTIAAGNGTDVQEVEASDTPTPFTGPQANNNLHDPMTERNPVSEIGFVVMRFKSKGKPMMATVYGKVQGTYDDKHMPGRPDQRTGEFGVFAAGPITMVITPEKADATRMSEIKVVLSSIRPNPEFIAYWRKVTTHLAQAYLNSAKAATAAEQAQFHDRSMAQFREQMGLKDAYTHQFCNYISSQQDYKDRQGRLVTLPDDYKYVYDDGAGNYLLSNDASYDTRGLGGGDWKQIEKHYAGQ